MIKVGKSEKQRRWDAGQKRKMQEQIYKVNCFDGNELEGVEPTRQEVEE